MVTAYLGLGSNLGERRHHLATALARLRAQPGILLTQVSSLYESASLGGPIDAPAFVNAVARIETELSAERLLDRLLWIEKQLGRVRTEANAPRVIDLDLLVYGDQIRSSPDPILPHPRLHERAFVLEPLAELAPNWIHPILKQSIAELRQSVTSASQPVRLLEQSTIPVRDATYGNSLAGLTAMVTGSTSGIGRAIALQLASMGADVIVHGRRSVDAAEQVANAIRQSGRAAEVMIADLSETQQAARFVDQAWDWTGRVELWINNAGADTLTGSAAQWSFERKLQELLAVDVTATMLLSRLAGERMRQRGNGVILTMGWDQAETGMEGDSGQLFAASKGAIMAFTRSLARELAPWVRVNCIAPGWIRTAWGETASISWQQRVEQETPLERWGLPDDIASTASWLCSPSASFVTGQIIRVNGGAV